MTINVSHFCQEVSKVRLSKDAFAELLTIRELFETVSQGVRFDTKVAYINPLQSSVLREELNRIRNMIDHESHVLILDGFKVDKLSTFNLWCGHSVPYSVSKWYRIILVIK